VDASPQEAEAEEAVEGSPWAPPPLRAAPPCAVQRPHRPIIPFRMQRGALAPPGAPARRAGAAAVPGARPAARGWLGRWLAWPKAVPGSLVVIAVVALVVGERGPIRHISRILGATALVGETAAAAASAGIAATSDLAVSVTDAMVSAVSGTLSLSQEVWHGLDLLNVSLRQVRGKFAGDDGNIITSWLESQDAAILHKLSADLVASLAASARSVSTATPHVQVRNEYLELGCSYVAYVIEARLLESGFTAVQYAVWKANYTPQWSNPMWAALEFPIEAEAQQIIAAVSALFNETPLSNLTWAEERLSDDCMATGSFAVLASARVRRLARRIWIVFQTSLWALMFPWR
jgi:hypothetical protein